MMLSSFAAFSHWTNYLQ